MEILLNIPEQIREPKPGLLLPKSQNHMIYYISTLWIMVTYVKFLNTRNFRTTGERQSSFTGVVRLDTLMLRSLPLGLLTSRSSLRGSKKMMQSIRILHSGSEEHDKGHSRNHGFYDPSLVWSYGPS